MIFATIGTSEPFDRLLAAVAELASADQVVMQCGTSGLQPDGVRCVEFLEYAELVDLIRRATTVVMHAGAGSVLTALANGRTPVVVPRLSRLGEAVDDHQVPFARRLHDAGLVIAVEDLRDLAGAVAQASQGASAPSAPGSALAGELREYIGSVVDPPRRPAVRHAS